MMMIVMMMINDGTNRFQIHTSILLDHKHLFINNCIRNSNYNSNCNSNDNDDDYNDNDDDNTCIWR